MKKLVRIGQGLHETHRLVTETTNGSFHRTVAVHTTDGTPTRRSQGAYVAHRLVGTTNGSSEDQGWDESQSVTVLGTTNGLTDLDQPATEAPGPSVEISQVEIEAYLKLRVLADTLWDIQQARISIMNRFKRAPVDVSVLLPHMDSYLIVEKAIGKKLDQQYLATVPPEIRRWQQEEKGIGEHLLARLLGHLGHPRRAFPHHWEGKGKARDGGDRLLVCDDPYIRSIGELWQYAGHGGPSRRRKGMSGEEVSACGNPKVKTVLHLLAEATIKEPGRDKSAWESNHPAKPILLTTPNISQSRSIPKPILLATGNTPAEGIDQGRPEIHMASVDPSRWRYRGVYEERRRQTITRTHVDFCEPCGPKGKAAVPGSTWSDKHRHVDALRIVGKEVLRDLWLVADG